MDYLGWMWLTVVVAAGIIEAMTMGLTTVWFAIGAAVAWIINTLGFSLYTQIIIFLVVSVLCLVITRPIAVKKLRIGKEKTNLDAIIGEHAKVISEIKNINGMGTVKYKGQIWSAIAVNEDCVIQKDEIVVIKSIKGVKLIVEKLK